MKIRLYLINNEENVIVKGKKQIYYQDLFQVHIRTKYEKGKKLKNYILRNI